ncbi:MAG: hypothetical protein CMJ34_05405 [Phycisphaerae bacterium]|nr:hypothetical protein [Phycisphaerae bacterium]
MMPSRSAELSVWILSSIVIAIASGCGGSDADAPSAPSKEAVRTEGSTYGSDAMPSPPLGSSVMKGSIQVQTAAGAFDIVPELIDFGAVGPGTINRGAFKLTNRGGQPVRVLRVTPSCVCTTLSDLAGKVIQPGETVSLEASLDAPKQAGEKEAKVFVQLEGMQQPAVVKLNGMVTLPVQPVPAFASALQGVENGTIRLSSIDGRPFRVLASNGSAPSFVAFQSGDDPRSSYELGWSVAGIAPQTIPRWWVFTTDRMDCPLVACRVRHPETGSRRDPTRFERRWIILDDFAELGSVGIGSEVDVPIQLDHYNPRGRGAIDRPDWSKGLSVRSLDPRIEATLMSSNVASSEQLDAVIRIRFNGPAELLLYAGIQVSTDTGTGVLEVAARVDP